MAPKMSLTACFCVVSSLLLSAQAGTLMAAQAAVRSAPADDPAFLVAAPDRGFLGNEETRDAFDAFARGRNAALVFVTDERTSATLDDALRAVSEKGARRLVVLPFFLSRSDPRHARVASLLTSRAPKLTVSWGRPFGESYFAVEELADRMRAIREAGKARVIVVGAGAKDDESRRDMLADWKRLTEAAAAGLGFESVHAVLEPSNARLRTALEEAARGADRSVIVPFHLGSKLDGMMSYTASIGAAAPANVELIDGDVTPDPSVGMWMAREANRQKPLRPEDVGVVLLAHGSDYHWNETMRQALAPLGQRYKVEPAFSMADPIVIERAVRRLEARGARFIVTLRLFGLAASFRDNVERLIGLDVEGGEAPDPHAGHRSGHEHGEARAPARIRTAAVMATTGGLEDDPLFAEALLARAQSLSRDPSRETVILVAHGDGDDDRDAHWREILASLAERMREMGGGRFRAIRSSTWREDWPEKREVAAELVRSLVRDASADGGRALVIPARTLGQGPERRLLEGLSFELGEGFAPLPLFARWAAKEVAAAIAQESKAREEASLGVAPQHASSSPPAGRPLRGIRLRHPATAASSPYLRPTRDRHPSGASGRSRRGWCSSPSVSFSTGASWRRSSSISRAKTGAGIARTSCSTTRFGGARRHAASRKPSSGCWTPGRAACDSESAAPRWPSWPPGGWVCGTSRKASSSQHSSGASPGIGAGSSGRFSTGFRATSGCGRCACWATASSCWTRGAGRAYPPCERARRESRLPSSALRERGGP
jgi:sirohydrochlorin ferrochelatase